MTTTTTAKTTTNNNGTNFAPNAAAAAQAWGQGTSEAYKAGVDATQKFWNTFAKTLNVPGFAAPTANLPETFEKMTAAMNGWVDSTARLATELNTVGIDTLRHNARTAERTGEALVAQFTGKANVNPTETARQIWDETVAFTNKAGERTMKAHSEHSQRVAQIVDEALTCKTCTKN